MSVLDKDLTEDEKQVYISALAYILDLDKSKDSENAKKEYLDKQMQEMDISAKEIKKTPKAQKTAEIIKMLKSISDIRIRRFIIREMILLAIADHEISDKEIATIYDIGIHTGIKQEKINDFFIWAAKGIEWQIEGSQLVDEDL